MRGCRAFELDDHAIGVVPDEAREILLDRKPIDKGPKAHSLDHSINSNALPLRQRDGFAALEMDRCKWCASSSSIADAQIKALQKLRVISA